MWCSRLSFEMKLVGIRSVVMWLKKSSHLDRFQWEKKVNAPLCQSTRKCDWVSQKDRGKLGIQWVLSVLDSSQEDWRSRARCQGNIVRWTLFCVKLWLMKSTGRENRRWSPIGGNEISESRTASNLRKAVWIRIICFLVMRDVWSFLFRQKFLFLF